MAIKTLKTQATDERLASVGGPLRHKENPLWRKGPPRCYSIPAGVQWTFFVSQTLFLNP